MNNTTVFHQTSGKGKTDLVLLHGWGMHSGIWDTVIDELAAHYRVTVIDLPGHGRSGSVPLKNLEELCESILDVAPLNAIYLGWSLGGLLALFLALHYPSRVKQVITVTASPCFLAKDDWPGMQADAMALFEKNVESNPAATLKTFVALQVLKKTSSKKMIKNILDNLFHFGKPEKNALLVGLKILADTDLRNELQKINCPCCHIFGEEDRIVPIAIAAPLHQLAPDHEIKIIEQAAHVPFISHKKEFLLHVKKVIDS